MNIRELKDYLNCDDAFLISLMENFVEEVKEMTSKINDATIHENWKVVKLNAHKMLSSVRIFEMNEVILILEKLEIEAEKKKPIVIRENVKKLLTHIDKVIIDVKISIEEIKQAK